MMPVGFLVSVVIDATATALALWPRPTNGPRATPAFVIESVANEVPFAVFSWLVASTLLALAQHDVDSPLGWTAVALGCVTTIGLVVVIARALQTRPTLDRALADAFGSNAQRPLQPRTGLWRALLSPLPLPAIGVRRDRDIAYGPAGDFNRLDVYRRRAGTADAPTLVYFHPGGFFSGSKTRAARPVVEQLARDGWVCINANYRLRGEGGFPNHLVDAKRVIAWAREHGQEYGADPNRLVVAGGSAGGNLAAMCALTPNDPRFQTGFEHVDTSVAAAVTMYAYYGSSGESDVPSAPGDYVHAEAPPFLVLHGTHDPMVPVQAAREFVDRLRAAGGRIVAYAELPGAQHNFDRLASIRCAAVTDAIEAFAGSVFVFDIR